MGVLSDALKIGSQSEGVAPSSDEGSSLLDLMASRIERESSSQEPPQLSEESSTSPPSGKRSALTESVLEAAEESPLGPTAIGIAQGATFGQTSRLLPGDTQQTQERIGKIREAAPVRYYLGEALGMLLPGPANILVRAGGQGLKFLTGLARGGREALAVASASARFAGGATRLGRLASGAREAVKAGAEFAGPKAGRVAEFAGGGAAIGAVTGTLGEGTEEISPQRGAISAGLGGTLGAAIPGVLATPGALGRVLPKVYNKVKGLLSDETVTAINNIEKFAEIKSRGARAVVAESAAKLSDYGKRASEILNTEIGAATEELSTSSRAFLGKFNEEIDKVSSNMERSLQQATAESNKQLTRDAVVIADLSEKAFQLKNSQYGKGLEAVKNANAGTRIRVEGSADEFGQAIEDMGFFKRTKNNTLIPDLSTSSPEDRDGIKALFKTYKLYKNKGSSIPFEDALSLKKDLAKITPFYGEITFRERGLRDAYFNLSKRLHAQDKLAGAENSLQRLDGDYAESRKVIDSIRRFSRGVQGPRRLILNAAKNVQTNIGVAEFQKLNKFAEIFPEETQEQITKSISNAGRILELGTVRPQQARSIRTKLIQAYEKGDRVSQKELDNLAELTGQYSLIGSAEDLVLSRAGIPKNISNALKDPAELELLEQFVVNNSPNSRPAFKNLLRNKEKLDLLKGEVPSSESGWVKALASDAQIPLPEKQSIKLLYDLFPKEAKAIEKAANELKIGKAAETLEKRGFGIGILDWAKRYTAFQLGGPGAVLVTEALTRPAIIIELLHRSDLGLSKLAASKIAQRMARVYEGINRVNALRGSELGKGISQNLEEQNGPEPELQ